MLTDDTTESPTFSILTPVTDPPQVAFESTVRSMLEQTYAHWQWVLVADGGAADWLAPRLQELAATDPRIHVLPPAERVGEAAALADALAVATGDFVLVLGQGDQLTKGALGRFAAVAEAASDLDLAYADHDLIAPDGTTGHTLRKPTWSPERLRHHDYVGHPVALRRELVEQVGGFRPQFEGAHLYDLVLRVGEQARTVHHMRRLLHHWRQVDGAVAEDGRAVPYVDEVSVRVVQDHLDRVGIAAHAEPGPAPGFLQLTREPDLTTAVSIVIPTIGQTAQIWGEQRTLVTETVRSLAEGSRHENVEYVIVHDTPTPPEVLDELRALRVSHGIDLVLVEFTEPFNFSAKCNVGAGHARGEVLAFLNDDMQARSAGVPEHLIAPLREDGVGLTGAKLFFEDGRIQHGGVRYGSGYRGDPYRLFDPEATGDAYELVTNREVSVLTGACVAVRRDVYERVGGFSENFPLNYNDVDLSMKVRHVGLRAVWLHDVELFHFESVTRDNSIRPWESDLMEQRWGDSNVEREPYMLTLP